MRKIKLILFIGAFLIFLSSNGFAQLISIGVGGGLTQVTGSELYSNKVSDGGYGFSSEYNFGAIGKVDLPLVPITPRAFVLYHKLNGSGENPLSVGTPDWEFSQSILSIGVGASYNFIPIPAGVDPYVALDVMFNSFGDFTVKSGGVETKTSGKSRTGIGIGAGAEVTILPKVNVDISASYRMFNLIGKESGEKTLSAINLDLFFMFSLL